MKRFVREFRVSCSSGGQDLQHTMPPDSDAKHPLDLTKTLWPLSGLSQSSLQTGHSHSTSPTGTINSYFMRHLMQKKPPPFPGLRLPHDPSHSTSSLSTPAQGISQRCLAALPSELFKGKSQVGCNSNSNKQGGLVIYL